MSLAFGAGSTHPRLRWGVLLATALICAAVAWLLPGSALPLACAGLVAAVATIVGVREHWVRTSQVDLFAPYCFPLLFVAFASLYPAWLILHDHVALMGFLPETYGPHTAGLIAMSVIGLAIGTHLWTGQAALPVDTGADLVPERRATEAGLLRVAGRSLAALLALVGVATALLAGPQSRGLNQSTYQVSDSMKAAALILALPAVLLILLSRQHLPATRRSSLVDVSLIGAMVIGSSLTGDRATAITVMLCAAFSYSRRTQSLARTLAPFLAITVFALAVLAYRQWAMQDQETHDPFRAIATDLSPASYTLGLVSDKVPGKVSYQLGLTYGDALAHQVPSIISGPIMGISHHSGTVIFRDQIVHLTDPNIGYGFSAPAEAYLNFGAIGVLVIALAIGGLLAWAYSRESWPSLRTRSVVYICLVAPLPYAYRSDALGAIKGFLYPVLLLTLALVVARRLASGPQPGWLARLSGSGSEDYAVGGAGPSRYVRQQESTQDQGDGGR